MRNGFKVIDIENHFDIEIMLEEWKKTMTPAQWSAMGGDSFADPKVKPLVDLTMSLGELRIKAMDAAGIDFAQISLTTPGAEAFPVAIGKKIATAANNALAKAIKKYPKRIGGWMALVPEDVKWSLKEIDRCAKMGLFGWSTLSNYHGKYLDDPKYLPILKKLASLNMPIYLHPNYSVQKEYLEFGYCLNGPSLGFTADTQLAYMRLIHRGVFDKIPNLKVIMGHHGEGFGFFKNRMDTAWRQGMGQPAKNIGVKIKHEPSYYLMHNTYSTSSGNYSQDALMCTVHALGNRAMMSTDMPYEDVKAMVDFIAFNKELSKKQKADLLYATAQRLGFGKKH